MSDSEVLNVRNCKLDTLLTSETKIDDSFPSAQFLTGGF